MKTTAYFDNIHKHILKELDNTNFNVTAAIAWFTDKDIFDLLCKKITQNVSVRVLLIKDHINTGQYGLNFEKFKNLGGQAFFIPDPRRTGVTMHHKFCVIDDKTVITGSYNWSKRARENYENITVIKGNVKFASQFCEEFENILARNGLLKKTGIRTNLAQILIRLDVIKNLVDLGETEEINRHLEKLRFIDDDRELNDIVSLLLSQDFDNVILKIDQYKIHRQAITEYDDPDISSLKLEIETLEIEINTLSDEKVEIERQVLIFNNMQNLIIGETLAEYFRLRKEKTKREWTRSEKDADKSEESEENREQRKNEYDEAKREYKEYKNDCEAAKDSDLIPELSKEKQKELKSLYRRASCLCHPDKVAETDKKRAKQAFLELTETYQKNDINALQKILQNLINGEMFAERTATITEKDVLKREIIYLRQQIEKVLDQIRQLVSTPSWRIINSIDDWDKYFDNQKIKLEEEIDIMRVELEGE